MELTLTNEQKIYLNKKGVITPEQLQKAYKNSVKEQQKIIKAAEKIRKSKIKNA
jgi:hypothetical protein